MRAKCILSFQGGTLNYYDDPTHKDAPPDFQSVLRVLNEHNLKILYANPRYSPVLLRVVGFLIEPLSK